MVKCNGIIHNQERTALQRWKTLRSFIENFKDKRLGVIDSKVTTLKVEHVDRLLLYRGTMVMQINICFGLLCLQLNFTKRCKCKINWNQLCILQYSNNLVRIYDLFTTSSIYQLFTYTPKSKTRIRVHVFMKNLQTLVTKLQAQWRSRESIKYTSYC